jgi:exosortase
MTMATTPPASVPKPSPPAQGDLYALVREAIQHPQQRNALLGAIGCVGVLGLIFQDNLWNLVYAWSTDENYSHGFLVPLISLYFANQAARRGPVAIRSGTVLGIALLVLALLVRLSTILVPIPFLGNLALIVGLAGVCSMLAGTEVLKRYWFAFFFLVFMVPLPIALYARIASPLQLLASQIASVVLNATGVPVLCEGNMMTLPGGVQMFVAEACSGMRQLTGFLALTAAVAYLSSRPGWYRVAVVASGMPIAITANVARVILTGYVMYFVDKHYASGAYHTIEGLVMMAFGLSLLRAECWVLDRIVALSGSKPSASEGAKPSTPEVPRSARPAQVPL